MKRQVASIVAILLLLLTACAADTTGSPTKTLPTTAPTMAPPAAAPTGQPTAEPEAEGPFESPLPTTDTFESPITLPNPASKFCEDQGYALEMRTTELGTAGYCIFPDGTECEEWAYFRGECEPGTHQP